MPEPSLTAGTVPGRIHPRSHIAGISAVLLPFTDAGRPDYDALAAIKARLREVD